MITEKSKGLNKIGEHIGPFSLDIFNGSEGWGDLNCTVSI